jgi:hypothetical protein
MKHGGMKQTVALSLYLMGMSAFVFFLPISGYGAGGEGPESSIGIDVSPNIINIESERWGDIRILSDMRYSFYAASGHSIFIYFNGSDSVENIRPTRDSLGNLILKFSLEDLLVLEDWLVPNAANAVKVVVVMDNGDGYTGHGEVYLAKKK